MSPEDRDQANAALLLDEKIQDRIAEALQWPSPVHALLENPAFRVALESYVQNEITLALQQLHERMRPVQYYGLNPTHTSKRYW